MSVEDKFLNVIGHYSYIQKPELVQYDTFLMYNHIFIGDRHSFLGPLHTRVKSRDHEIVRAQEKVSKGRPKTPPKSCRVVTDP
jgi:hypothetical protein